MNNENKTSDMDNLLGKFDEIEEGFRRSRPRGTPSSARPSGIPKGSPQPPRPASGRPAGTNSADNGFVDVRPTGLSRQNGRPTNVGPASVTRPTSGRPAGTNSADNGARPAGSSRPNGRPTNNGSASATRPSGKPKSSSQPPRPASGRSTGARPYGNGFVDVRPTGSSRANSRPANNGSASATRPNGRPANGRPANAKSGQSVPPGTRPRNGKNNRPLPPGARPQSGKGGRPLPPGKLGKRKKGRKKHTVLKSVLASIFLIILVVMAAGVLWVYSAIKDIPEVDPTAIATMLNNSSTIYDDKGNEIKNIYIGDEQRELVTYDRLPDTLKNAFIAIEDKTFEEHSGFNYIRILGAIKESIFGGGRVSGTSTITQQLARNIWLTDSKSDYDMNRKIVEAYYAVQLEKKLNKDEILTDYLNTISLGYHSYGVQAAAKNYFNKDVSELDLVECAALASLPQLPTTYAMIVAKSKGSIAKDDPILLKKGKLYDYVYNDNVEDRVKLVLKFMLEQKKITQTEYDAAVKENLRDHIVVTEPSGNSTYSFFVDYAINNVAKNLMKEYPDKAVDMETALQMVYTGGYAIHSTMNRSMQKIAVEEFEKGDNFPSITLSNVDGDSNILDDNGKIMLYRYSNLFDNKGNFTLKSHEAKLQKDGSLILYKSNTGKADTASRLVFYKTTVGGKDDVSIEFKNLYQRNDSGIFYIINGGYINVPQGYKTLDDNGNCIISAEFMTANPDFFAKKKSGYSLSSKSLSVTLSDGTKTDVIPYSLSQKMRQPQSAFVLLENKTGRVKAMVGGRSVEGEMNYNRATSPRQPGSTIKPISVYGPAIQMGAEGEPVVNGDKSFGEYWTPLSIIVDEKMTYSGRDWPKNWYSGFRGSYTLRKSIEQSVNVNAVKVQLNIGTEKSSQFLKNLGVTTLVEKGETNDMNPAALALGGMTRGISPLEMASAYSAFPNSGVHNDPIAYSSVEQRDGTVILDGKTENTKAMDEGTAFIMTDILRTTVTNGLGRNAQLSGIPTAGKTGTTSEKYDFWFVGFTPKYSAALWIGGDVNIDMTGTSANAASLWSTIMGRCLEGKDAGSFPSQPADVVKSSVGGYSDYFIKGTVPNKILYSSESVKICTESGYLATPWCPETENKTFSGADGKSAPEYYCPMHNMNPGKYPIKPGEKLDTSFDPNAEEEEPEETDQPSETVKPETPTTPPTESTEPAEPETPTTPTEPVDPAILPETPTDNGTVGRRVRMPKRSSGRIC